MSKLKETKKMKVTQVHEQNPKQFLNPPPTQNSAHQGPKKSKIAQKLSQIQMSELKATTKMKVLQIRVQTPKQLSNRTPTTKIAQD